MKRHSEITLQYFRDIECIGSGCKIRETHKSHYYTVCVAEKEPTEKKHEKIKDLTHRTIAKNGISKAKNGQRKRVKMRENQITFPFRINFLMYIQFSNVFQKLKHFPPIKFFFHIAHRSSLVASSFLKIGR